MTPAAVHGAGRAGRRSSGSPSSSCRSATPRGRFARGGVETGRGHYPSMVVLHTGLLVGCARSRSGCRRPAVRARARLADARARAARRRRCAGGASPPSAGSGTPGSSSCPGCRWCAAGPTAALATPTTSPSSSRGSRCRWCTRPGSPPLVFTVLNAALLRVRIRVRERGARAPRRAQPAARMTDASTCWSSAAVRPGCATALYAARAGLAVAVLEPRAGPVDKACGEGLMPGGGRRARATRRRPGRASALRGIRYVAGAGTAEARFRAGPGRGVRRTDAARGAAPAAARRAGCPRSSGGAVDRRSARTTTAVHVDGDRGALPACRGRAALAGAARARARRGRPSAPPALRPAPPLRASAPWTDYVEVHWAPRGRGLRDAGGRRTWSGSRC